MDCPRCGLLNPSSAQRCDCGYDFVSGKIESSYLAPKEKAERSSRWRRSYWPDIYDLESSKKAGRLGATAAFLCAGVTALFALLAELGWALVKGFDIWALGDAIIIGALGIGVWRMSRICAVLALVTYTAERLFAWATNGSSNPMLAVIFIVYFINGVRGTFAYQEYKTESRTAKLPLGF